MKRRFCITPVGGIKCPCGVSPTPLNGGRLSLAASHAHRDLSTWHGSPRRCARTPSSCKTVGTSGLVRSWDNVRPCTCLLKTLRRTSAWIGCLIFRRPIIAIAFAWSEQQANKSPTATWTTGAGCLFRMTKLFDVYLTFTANLHKHV